MYFVSRTCIIYHFIRVTNLESKQNMPSLEFLGQKSVNLDSALALNNNARPSSNAVPDCLKVPNNSHFILNLFRRHHVSLQPVKGIIVNGTAPDARLTHIFI